MYSTDKALAELKEHQLYLTDTHIHLLHLLREQKIEVIDYLSYCARYQIKNFICLSVDIADSLSNLNFQKEHALTNIQYALGIHPLTLYTNKYHEEDLLQLQELAQANKYIALGEIGLDKYYSKKYNLEITIAEQEELFRKQLFLSQELELPCLVHAVGTIDLVIKQFKDKNLTYKKGILHAFNGSWEQAQELITLGYTLGIGPLLLNSPKLQKIVQRLDISNILLETDLPYMTAHDFNTIPKLLEIFTLVCNLQQESAKNIALTLNSNYKKLFFLQ